MKSNWKEYMKLVWSQKFISKIASTRHEIDIKNEYQINSSQFEHLSLYVSFFCFSYDLKCTFSKMCHKNMMAYFCLYLKVI